VATRPTVPAARPSHAFREYVKASAATVIAPAGTIHQMRRHETLAR
jgi:hypothetical protein